MTSIHSPPLTAHISLAVVDACVNGARRINVTAATINLNGKVRCVRRTIRRHLYPAVASLLGAYRLKTKVVICKALAVVIEHNKIERHELLVISTAAGSSSLYGLSTSGDQGTMDAHQVSLFGAAMSPFCGEVLFDSPAVDAPLYSAFASPLTDVEGPCSPFATPLSGIEEYIHSLFVTPLTDVDEFYSPSVSSLADSEGYYYSPLGSVDSPYWTAFPSPAPSSATQGMTPYFSPDLDVAANLSVASSGIGLGILMPIPLTPESESAEFLSFDTPLSSVTLWDECSQDELWSPADVSILAFVGEPVYSDDKADKLVDFIEAADVPLPDSPAVHDDLVDAVNVPLPDSPVELMVAEDIPLPDSPVEVVAAENIPLPESPVEVVEAENIPLPESPVEVVEAESIPLPESPVEVVEVENTPFPESPVEIVEAESIPLPDSPADLVEAMGVPYLDSLVDVIDAAMIPLPNSPVEFINAVDIPLPDSPIGFIDASEIPLPDSPFVQVEAADILLPDSPVIQVEAVDIPLPDSPLVQVAAADIPLPNSPVIQVEAVDIPFPDSSFVQFAAADVPLPDSPMILVDVLDIPLPGSPVEEAADILLPQPERIIEDIVPLSCGPVKCIELTDAAFVPLPNSPRELTGTVGPQFAIPRASPVFSVASTESSPVLQFGVPGSPSIACGYESLDELAQHLADFSLQGDVTTVEITKSAAVEPVSPEYIFPRASPALSAASSCSSPATRFMIPSSPVLPRPYTVYSQFVSGLDFEKAIQASPEIDTIIDAFASASFDSEESKGKELIDSSETLKTEVQVRARPDPVQWMSC